MNLQNQEDIEELMIGHRGGSNPKVKLNGDGVVIFDKGKVYKMLI